MARLTSDLLDALLREVGEVGWVGVGHLGFVKCLCEVVVVDWIFCRGVIVSCFNVSYVKHGCGKKESVIYVEVKLVCM